MPLKVLCTMKDTPLPIAVDFYRMICDSLVNDSKNLYDEMLTDLSFDLFKGNNEEACVFCNWYDAVNDIRFTEGYISLFDTPADGLWIAYECLSLILYAAKDGRYGKLQVFYFRNKKFWVTLEDGLVVFLLPEEY